MDDNNVINIPPMEGEASRGPPRVLIPQQPSGKVHKNDAVLVAATEIWFLKDPFVGRILNIS